MSPFNWEWWTLGWTFGYVAGSFVVYCLLTKKYARRWRAPDED